MKIWLPSTGVNLELLVLLGRWETQFQTIPNHQLDSQANIYIYIYYFWLGCKEDEANMSWTSDIFQLTGQAGGLCQAETGHRGCDSNRGGQLWQGLTLGE